MAAVAGAGPRQPAPEASLSRCTAGMRGQPCVQRGEDGEGQRGDVIVQQAAGHCGPTRSAPGRRRPPPAQRQRPLAPPRGRHRASPVVARSPRRAAPAVSWGCARTPRRPAAPPPAARHRTQAAATDRPPGARCTAAGRRSPEPPRPEHLPRQRRAGDAKAFTRNRSSRRILPWSCRLLVGGPRPGKLWRDPPLHPAHSCGHAGPLFRHASKTGPQTHATQSARRGVDRSSGFAIVGGREEHFLRAERPGRPRCRCQRMCPRPSDRDGHREQASPRKQHPGEEDRTCGCSAGGVGGEG